MMCVELIKSFFLTDSPNWWVLESFRPLNPKTFDCYFEDDVDRGHEKFFLADSSDHMGVKVLSASWALKRLIATFQTWSTSRSCNIFPRRFERTDRRQSPFGLLSPKTFDCYILDMMYVAFVKNFFSPILENWFALESFRPPEPKNVWFPLCRHDVRRVHEKFFLHDSSEMMGVRVISASWAQKRLIATF